MSLFDSILGDRVFITGGTGSLGSALTRYILENSNATVVCYSRDPHKQAELERSVKNRENLRLNLGDIRDADRLAWTMRGASTVIHTAALKHVDLGELNSGEFISTNIDGSRNVQEAAIKQGVRKALFIASDKQVQSLNLYGRTKAVAERSWILNNVFGRGKTRLSALRYGNVFDSRGNVIEAWKSRIARNLPIVVREPEPSRFVCRLDWGIQWVLNALFMMIGGEVFIPANLKAISMWDLATQFSPRDYWQIEPLGGGEKQHEMLLAPEELRDTVHVKDFWILNPTDPQWAYERWKGKSVDSKAICSGTAERMKMSEFMEMFGV